MNGQDLKRLRRMISIAEKLIATNPKPRRGRPAGSTNMKPSAQRVRRTGTVLARFRKMLKAQRKRGVPVSELARQHGISSAYIYMIG